MPLTADILLDRHLLKRRITKWRTIAFIAVIIGGFALLNSSKNDDEGGLMEHDYIARIKVEDVISEDSDREEILAEIKEDPHVKAVIMDINSPGGTVVGGEMLYNDLRDLAEKKPLVTVLGTLAASGGYMTAIAADRIFAQHNTITASVGVILETGEVTELAKKLGINFITIKSGPLKAVPSPFEKFTPAGEESINQSIHDSFLYFINLVKDRRKLSPEIVKIISDGRIVTGDQALRYGLVDAIGGEKQAKEWLTSAKHIPAALKVVDKPLKKKKGFLHDVSDSMIGNYFPSARVFSLDGLLAIWHPVL